MTAQTDLMRELKKLRIKAIEKGVYENFGDKEIRKMKEKHGDIGLVRDFEMWCLNADDRKIMQGY